MKKENTQANLQNEQQCSQFSDAALQFNWTTDSIELLHDLKLLMKEYYVATFTNSGNELKLSFNNGQSFIISIRTCA